MTIELDHVFVLTEPGAASADALIDIGLIEAERNDHPGQGTANRRFFFANTALEYLYVRDANEAASGCGRRLRLGERAADADASPFGLIVRSTRGPDVAPFPGWRYQPAYLPAGQCFHVGDNSDLLTEPFCACLPVGQPIPADRSQSPNTHWILTELRIDVPVASPSPALQAIANCELVSLRLNEPHYMELVFNEQRKGLSKDMMPQLPLVVHW